MSTTISNRHTVDLPEWRALQQPYVNGASPIAQAGPVMAPDMRCRDYASPHSFIVNSGSVLCSYNQKLDGWNFMSASGLGGTYGAGSASVFVPSMSPSGTITTGATVDKVTLSTALPSSVAVNQLSNRGDGLGFIVRIIGNATGSSGKTEERRIIANTSGTTPTIYFDKPLSFTPISGDRYEFLAGSAIFLNTGVSSTANIFRRYDVLTNSFSALSTTNLIATINATHNQLIVLDEQYVPCDRNPGEGFLVGAATYDVSGDFSKGCLTAQATATGTITGQASSGDASIVANQFRNYQIRIVEDTGAVTAVGQRRRITSHTAGPSPVYTLSSNWTTTPSSTAKFVIENDTDKIIGFMGGATTIYNYSISGNTWDTTTWAARGTALSSGGLTWYAFGISPNNKSENTVKSSNIISFRGTSTTYDVFDIAGAATGSWTNGLSNIQNGNSGSDSWVGANDYYYFAYNPHTQGGVYMYTAMGTNTSGTNVQRQYCRFNSVSGYVEKIAGPRLIGGGTNGYAGNASFVSMYQDGNTKLAFYNAPRIMSAGVDYFQLMLTF